MEGIPSGSIARNDGFAAVNLFERHATKKVMARQGAEGFFPPARLDRAQLHELVDHLQMKVVAVPIARNLEGFVLQQRSPFSAAAAAFSGFGHPAI